MCVCNVYACIYLRTICSCSSCDLRCNEIQKLQTVVINLNLSVSYVNVIWGSAGVVVVAVVVVVVVVVTVKKKSWKKYLWIDRKVKERR